MSTSSFLRTLLFALLLCQTALAQEAAKSTGPAVATNYVLKANDEISIRVYRNPELDGPRRISKDGTIDFPLVGIVNVAGKTQYEAASHLAALLDKDYLVRPQIFVSLLSTTKRHFNVLGQVATPGVKDYPEEPLDILSALSAAGGFTRLANQSSIKVRRLENGRDQTIRVDLKQLSRDRDAKPFMIQPNDTIVVDERFF